MSLRRVTDRADSLGLLFDTICNAFGGIVVIAVLVALMSQDIKQNDDAASASQSNAMILARRMDRASNDLHEIQSALVALREQSKTTASQSQDLDKRQQLAQELTQLQNQISSSQRQLEEAQKVDALTDPGQKKEEITSRQNKADQDINDLNEKINQLTNDFQNLQQQSIELVSQYKEASKPNVKNLRLPKEHSTDKNPWFVILKGGDVYSKLQFADGQVEDNPSSFTVDKNGDDETWTPKPGGGVAITDKNAISNLLSIIKQNGFYASFVVYNDSFATFISLRDSAISQGIEYGWVPQELNDPLVFSSAGSAPQPQ